MTERPARNDRAFDVVVLGDANPDVILRGDVVPRFGQVEQMLDSAELSLGGSAAIVACGLTRLGVRTALVSVVGRDVYGDYVLDSLASFGVDTRWVSVHPDLPTGLTVVLSSPDDRAILTFPGTIPTLAASAVDPSWLADGRHVHVASPFLQPLLTAGLPGLLHTAQRAGVTTSLDTNWDPDQTWVSVLDALAFTDVLLPNAAELLALHRRITGADAATSETVDELDHAARQITALGTTVALKDGAAGARLWTPDGRRVQVPGLDVDVVDTTGAGDSFDAGYLAGLLEGLEPKECLRLAVAAGSLSTRAAGGTGAQAHRGEIRDALAASVAP